MKVSYLHAINDIKGKRYPPTNIYVADLAKMTLFEYDFINLSESIGRHKGLFQKRYSI